MKIFNIFNIFVSIVLTLVASSCNESDHIVNGLGEEDFTPKYFSFTSSNCVNVLDATKNIMADGKNKKHTMTLAAENKIIKAGVVGISSIESLVKRADSRVVFSYNYGINNEVKVAGLTMEYIHKGQSYKLYCLDELEIRGNHEIVSSETAPFHEESVARYTLVAINQTTKVETVVATVEQEFEVGETVVNVDSDHKKFIPDATVEGNFLIVSGVNIAIFKKLFCTGEESQPVSQDYDLTHYFNMTTSKIVVDNAQEIVGKTYSVAADGSVVIEGARFTFEYDAEKTKVSDVIFEDVNYKDVVKKCAPSVRKVTIKSTTEAEVCIYENDENDCAMATVAISVEERAQPVTVKNLRDAFSHIGYRPVATANGNILSVICDNKDIVFASYSDNTEKKVDSIPYTCINKFMVEMPSVLEVAKKSSLYGKIWAVTNGEVVVEGYTIKIVKLKPYVSEIKYDFDGKTYNKTDNAPICSATVKSIRFNADATMTVVFDGEGEVIEGKLPVNITEKVEAIELEGEIVAGYATDSYWDHVAGLEGTYQHIITRLENGAYKHYSRKEGDKNFTVAELTAEQGFALLSQKRAFAWYRNGEKYLLGTVEGKEFDDQKGHYLLNYYTMDGALACRLGVGEETIGKSFRYPIQSTLTKTAKGWTFGGNEYFK